MDALVIVPWLVRHCICPVVAPLHMTYVELPKESPGVQGYPVLPTRALAETWLNKAPPEQDADQLSMTGFPDG